MSDDRRDVPGDPDDGAPDNALQPDRTDSAFPALPTASSIFGEATTREQWATRRERRAAERFRTPASESRTGTGADPDRDPAVQAPAAGADPADAAADARADPGPAAQAPAAGAGPLPPRPTPPRAPVEHPLAISLPTAITHRDERLTQSQQADSVRRTVDPDGIGHEDVDWLGRARAGTASGAPAAPQVLPPAAQPVAPAEHSASATEDAVTDDIPVVTGPLLPAPPSVADRSAASEPPSFTDLLRQPVPPPVRHRVPPQLPPLTEAPSPVQSEDDTATPAVGIDPHQARSATDAGSEENQAAEPAAFLEAVRPVPAPLAPATPAVQRGEARAPEMPSPTPAPIGAAVDTSGVDLPAADDRREETETRTMALPVQRAPRSLDEILGLSAPPAGPPSPDATEASPAPGGSPARTSWPLGDRADADAPPADVDQSEWDGRETSDTRTIRAVFGTGALEQVHPGDHDPLDGRTRMMPTVVPTGPAPGPESAPRPVQLVNEGFARLQSEGRRGKQLLVGGAIAIIVLMIIAVFLLARWIIGGDISNHVTPSTSATPKAAVLVVPSAPPRV